MFILPHQGLGDHIICNGLVRCLAEEHQTVSLIVSRSKEKSKGTGMIEFMYRDNPNIKIVGIEEADIRKTYEKARANPKEYITVGYGYPKQNNGNFDEWFYRSVNIDFKYRLEKFYIKRDLEAEEQIYNELTNGEPYIFIHDDPTRGFVIQRERLRKDLKIIENDISINFFNYRKLFENAKELHLMQSGLYDFTNSIPLKKPNIFVHQYVRKYSSWYDATSCNNRIEIA